MEMMDLLWFMVLDRQVQYYQGMNILSLIFLEISMEIQDQDGMLADQLEFCRLLLWLQSMPDREVVHCTLDKPSPLAFPLFVDRLRERLSSETLESRLKRMAWA